MKLKLSLAASIPLFIATGCTPTVTETPPQVKTSSQWNRDISFLEPQLSHTAITENEAGIRTVFHWWELYEDEILNSLEKEALENSPTLQAALNRYEEALWTLGIYESDLYPSISLSSGATRRRIPKDLRPSIQVPTFDPTPQTSPPPTPIPQPTMKTVSGPKHSNDLNASFVVQYEVDLWGKYRLTRDQYRAIAEASLEEVDAIQLLLTYQIAEMYFTIRYYEEDIDFLRNIILCVNEELHLAKTRYEAGLTNISPYLEIISKEKSLEAQKAELIGLKEKALAALAALVGKDSASFSLPEKKYEWRSITPPVELPSEVIVNRPDVQRNTKELEALQAQIGIAKTAYLPSISLSGLLGYESNKANSLFKWKNRIWAANASIGMLLLDAGGRTSEIKAAQARFQAKASEYIDSCLTAIKEVEEALSTCYAQKLSVNAFLEQERQNQILAKVDEERFSSGIIAYQEVLQRKSDILSSQRSLLEAQYNYQVASLHLVKAIGGSWAQRQD